MKASRTKLIWLTLALCAFVVLSGMTWLTYRSVQHQQMSARAEANQEYAELRADIEERTRLSLWRLDAYASGLLVAENQIPAEGYLNANISGLYEDAIQTRFEITSDKQVIVGTTNQAKPEENVALQEFADLITEAESNTREPNHALTRQRSATPVLESKRKLSQQTAPTKLSKKMRTKGDWKSASKAEIDTYQSFGNINEKVARSQAFEIQNSITSPQNIGLSELNLADAFQVSTVTPFQPKWHSDELFLSRSCHLPNKAIQQGTWLDKDALMNALLAQVEDLLPRAQLIPIEPEEKADKPLALVSLPLLLVTNEILTPPTAPCIKLDSSLWVAWAGAIFALLAGIILIRGILRLSERRATFVSSVTHELRTPLTTFQLYTDILQSDILKSEKKQEYLGVLSRESKRLAHLVENVLVFSKLERGSAKSNNTSGNALSLLDPIIPRLTERLETVDLKLQVDYPNPFSITVDTNKLEHILFNLIDNVAKYATPSSSPLVHLTLTQSDKKWSVAIRDHGPGVPSGEQTQIFKAFHKSAHQAAESAPGVGLGLALSQRLADSMQGTLHYTDAPDGGAIFTLSLPA